jgi:enoyl-CoA hydratase/carnithine racemase
VRIAKIIGVGRLTEMMLTGRKLDADEGNRVGLSHHLVEPGAAMTRALEIPDLVAGNARISNYMMLNALEHIGNMPPEAGLFTESLAQALTLTSDHARAGIDAFLKKKDISF